MKEGIKYNKTLHSLKNNETYKLTNRLFGFGTLIKLNKYY